MSLWTCFLIFCQIFVCVCEDPRRKLLNDILGEKSGYRMALTPMKDPSESLQVSVGLTLRQIRALDERHQYLQIMVWIRFVWVDENLTWNVTEYGNVTRLHIPASDMWRPDIVLYNSVDQERQADQIMPETNIQVWFDGRAVWTGPVLLQSSCKVRVAEYPFDIQHCPLKFGPWAYNGFEVNVTNEDSSASMVDFIPNEQWEVIEMPAERHDFVYDCCPEPYPDVTFTLVIRRKPMFYLFNLLFPCVLLTVLGILVFCLPPESGEKVSLAITVLLAMSVYQLIIIDNIPRTSEEIPVLNQYFSASIVLLCLSTILAVLVMNWHFDGIHGVRAPRWVRFLVLDKLARLVCLAGEAAKTHTSEKLDAYETKMKMEKANVAMTVKHKGNGNEILRESGNLDNIGISNPAFDTSNESTTPVGTAEQILEEIKDYRETTDHSANIEAEWKLIALILDRTFLIVFSCLTIAVTVGIFAKVTWYRAVA